MYNDCCAASPNDTNDGSMMDQWLVVIMQSFMLLSQKQTILDDSSLTIVSGNHWQVAIQGGGSRIVFRGAFIKMPKVTYRVQNTKTISVVLFRSL